MCMFKIVFVLIPIVDDNVLLLLLLFSFVSIFTKQCNFPCVFRDVAFAHKRLRGINCSHSTDLTVILCCFILQMAFCCCCCCCCCCCEFGLIWVVHRFGMCVDEPAYAHNWHVLRERYNEVCDTDDGTLLLFCFCWRVKSL
jgi:hypothetical protein